MTIELDDIDLSSDLTGVLDWAIDTGIWDGRQVSWTQASDLREEIHSRIFEILFKNPDHPLFEQLAWVGASNSAKSLLVREFQELDFSKNDLILQAGFQKSVKKFWKKHKKEILIGAAIVAVVIDHDFRSPTFIENSFITSIYT